MPIDISVVIPVYNAGKSLRELQSRIDRALSGKFCYEVIYVNDASSDDSLSVLMDMETQHSGVRVLSHNKNLGQHESVIHGLKHARGNLIANIDDDLQHDPAHIPVLAEILLSEHLDIVYAVPEHNSELGSFMRDMLFMLLFRAAKGVTVSSFRVYTGGLAQTVLNNLRPFNYFSALALQNPVKARSVRLAFCQRKHGQSNYSFLMRLIVYAKIIIYYGPWRRQV